MADPTSGPTIVYNAAFGVGVGPSGGTSLSAPQMAAMWALVLQACKADAVCSTKGTGPHAYRLGNPNGLFYKFYSNPTMYAGTFYDVLYGNNSANPNPGPTPGPTPAPIQPGYSAGPGYDLVTGVGVPFAGHLINAVLSAEGGTSPNLP